MKTTHGSIRPLSATAPTASATLFVLLAIEVKLIKGGKSLRDGREHALVDGKEEIRDPPTANRWSGQHLSETNVGQIPNESPGRVREGE